MAYMAKSLIGGAVACLVICHLVFVAVPPTAVQDTEKPTVPDEAALVQKELVVAHRHSAKPDEAAKKPEAAKEALAAKKPEAGKEAKAAKKPAAAKDAETKPTTKPKEYKLVMEYDSKAPMKHIGQNRRIRDEQAKQAKFKLLHPMGATAASNVIKPEDHLEKMMTMYPEVKTRILKERKVISDAKEKKHKDNQRHMTKEEAEADDKMIAVIKKYEAIDVSDKKRSSATLFGMPVQTIPGLNAPLVEFQGENVEQEEAYQKKMDKKSGSHGLDTFSDAYMGAVTGSTDRQKMNPMEQVLSGPDLGTAMDSVLEAVHTQDKFEDSFKGETKKDRKAFGKRMQKYNDDLGTGPAQMKMLKEMTLNFDKSMKTGIKKEKIDAKPDALKKVKPVVLAKETAAAATEEKSDDSGSVATTASAITLLSLLAVPYLLA